MISVTPVKKNKQMLVNPFNLERDENGPFEWRATNGDPQFAVANAAALADKWVRLRVTIKTDAAVSSSLVVYQDVGDGFSETNAHYLLPDAAGNIDFCWRLPAALRALRIDPVSQVVRLSIPHFEMQPVSVAQVILRSAWAVATRHPGKLQTKTVAAIRMLKTHGLKTTVKRIISASNEMAHNPSLGSAHSAEHLAKQRQEHPERAATLESYVQDGFRRSNSKVTWRSSYVPKAPDAIDLHNLPLKLIAFYLPQFHPFAENDAWWGKGFTEWTNVSKAQPQYLGHHQPRLPSELGYYDLRLPEVMRQQIDLAHHYGVTGFCFHHYWFGGKRLMERPVNQFLADPTLNIDFCLCWANENWTRRWDGAEADVLIAQKHSREDDIAFFADILPALLDPRYIKVNNKPVLIVYRATLLPNAAETAQRWRELAQQAGLPGLYLVAAKAFEITDPRPFGFDAAVEFPPHQVQASEISQKKTFINADFSGKIYNYRDIAEKYASHQEDRFTNFKTVMPSWDNEARKPGKGHIFDGADPGSYAKWLDLAAQTTITHKRSERLLFVNAWNEWAEGAHLEPDRHYGYAYLHATASVLRNLCPPDIDTAIAQLNQNFKKQHEAVVILHLYYDDLIDGIFSKYLSALQSSCDLVVTVRPDVSQHSLDHIKHFFPNVYFMRGHNRGRDIRPFIQALKTVTELGYQYVCKLHSKKSIHRDDGGEWRDALFGDLVGSAQLVQATVTRFQQDAALGILAPSGSLMPLADASTHIDNREWLNALLHRQGKSELIGGYDILFPAGSMYWARVCALQDLLNPKIIDLEEFEFEAGQRDGTLAHAIERLVALMAKNAGYSVREVS